MPNAIYPSIEAEKKGAAKDRAEWESMLAEWEPFAVTQDKYATIYYFRRQVSDG